MLLTGEQLIENWETFMENLIEFTEGDRQKKLVEFYKAREEEFCALPASGHINHHSAWTGGYVYHVNNVVELSQYMYALWNKFDAVEGFTKEELVFAAIHHDMGKMGDMNNILYQPTNEQWKRDKGSMYEYNPEIPFMSIPDRSIFLLNQIGVVLSENEFISIKVHDGLYDDANKAYIMSTQAPRLRNNMPYILHQADLAAARIEYGRDVIDLAKLASEKIVEKPVDSKIKKKLKAM